MTDAMASMDASERRHAPQTRLGKIEAPVGLAERVASHLREQILSGALQRGQLLPSEPELAKQLGVSRGSVREALNILAAQKILIRRQGFGTAVGALSPQELMEPFRFAFDLSSPSYEHLHEARMVLEPTLAALAAERGTEEELETIRTLLVEEAQLVRGGREREPHTFEDRVRIDTAFHESIARASSNPTLVHIMLLIHSLVDESRRRTARIAGISRPAHRTHLHVYEALRQRDAQAARATMTKHLRLIHAYAAREVARQSGGRA